MDRKKSKKHETQSVGEGENLAHSLIAVVFVSIKHLLAVPVVEEGVAIVDFSGETKKGLKRGTDEAKSTISSN